MLQQIQIIHISFKAYEEYVQELKHGYKDEKRQNGREINLNHNHFSNFYEVLKLHFFCDIYRM